jgi:hypothetical protein
MKRCPIERGGCGELVEMLFDSGVCQKCDAMIAKGTASVGGPPKRRGGRRKLVAGNGQISEEPPRVEAHPEPCRKYVKGPERGICATCQATRAAHLAAKKNRVAPAAPKKRGPGRAGGMTTRWSSSGYGAPGPRNTSGASVRRRRGWRSSRFWTKSRMRCEHERAAATLRGRRILRVRGGSGIREDRSGAGREDHPGRSSRGGAGSGSRGRARRARRKRSKPD